MEKKEARLYRNTLVAKKIKMLQLEKLYLKLTKLGTPEEDYYLHGLYGSTSDNNKLAMIVKKGEYFVEYEIYYKEKGQKDVIQVFTDFDLASDYFIKQLNQSRKDSK